jgi:regulator of ribonuclease activity A
MALANGWAAIVINGCVRDVAALAGIDLGIKALAACPRPSAKLGAGDRDIPVSFGAITFHPGATLAGDDDGIVVLPSTG